MLAIECGEAVGESAAWSVSKHAVCGIVSCNTAVGLFSTSINRASLVDGQSSGYGVDDDVDGTTEGAQ